MSSLPLPIAAFAAGLISFLSPCVLPLVPGYISLISGTGAAAAESEPGAPSDGAGAASMRSTVLMNSVMFILGFTVVFMALGAVATGVGQLLGRYRSYFLYIAGAVIVIFGLHLTGLLRINALYSDKRMHGIKGGSTPIGAFLVGFAFAFGWSPCIGPILGAILTLAASQNTLPRGMLLLGVYSLGLAVPFLLTSWGINHFLKFYSRFRTYLHAVEVASGVLLIALGVLVFVNKF